MSKKPESRLQRQIRKAIEAEFGGWWRKQWGGQFTGAGLPDLLGYVQHSSGIAVCFQLEVKLPHRRSKPTVLQLQTIYELRKQGVVADIVRSVDEAIKLVRWYAEGPTIRISKQSLTFWSNEEILRTLHAARHRENVRRSRRRWS